jgi:putative tricarboxylic transport membrane protein
MRRRHLLLATPALLALPAGAEPRLPSLYMFIPAGPGGGWDGLGRAIEQVARPAGLVGSFQFEIVGGAGGQQGANVWPLVGARVKETVASLSLPLPL